MANMNEIHSKEHDGTNKTKGKRIFAYGWDYTNLRPTKIRCDENGKIQVNRG